MLYKVNLTDEFSGGLFQRNDRWYSIGSEDDGPPSNGHFRVCGSSVKTAAIEKEDPQNNTNNKRKEWKEKGKKTVSNRMLDFVWTHKSIKQRPDPSIFYSASV